MEFYISVFLDIFIGYNVLNNLNYVIEYGHLSIDQKGGIIILIPKKEKDKPYLENLRPVTPFNVD